MAILLGNTVWEGTSIERPNYGEAQGARNGHFFKELDTGETYHRQSGEWHFINLGLSFVKATKSGLATTDSDGKATITFTTPFINNEYGINLACEDQGSAGDAPTAGFENQTVSGFDIRTRKAKNGNKYPSIKVSWLATRHYNP